MDTSKRDKQQAIEQANYRLATEDDNRRNCDNCRWKQNQGDAINYCGLWEFFFELDWVCDSHRFRTTGF